MYNTLLIFIVCLELICFFINVKHGLNYSSMCIEHFKPLFCWQWENGWKCSVFVSNSMNSKGPLTVYKHRSTIHAKSIRQRDETSRCRNWNYAIETNNYLRLPNSLSASNSLWQGFRASTLANRIWWFRFAHIEIPKQLNYSRYRPIVTVINLQSLKTL